MLQDLLFPQILFLLDQSVEIQVMLVICILLLEA